jgi:hypothetical protein
MAGTAVYMTISRLEENRPWENGMAERKWLYQTPMDILIKASNGLLILKQIRTTTYYRFYPYFRTRRRCP